MSPFIKKEIRLLLPAWIGAMVLAIFPAWIAGSAWILNYSVNDPQSGIWLEGIVPIIFALGTLLLGLSPFGQEFSQGTFSVLLSQPAERSRIWWTKITLAATAFLFVWFAAVVSLWCQFFLFNHSHPLPAYNLRYHFLPAGHLFFMGGVYRPFLIAFDRATIFITLSVLVVFSGGLWTTLLLRQVTNAFWFTLLAPLAIMLGIMSMLSDRIASDQSVGRIIVVALVVYSVAGFCLAALLFRRCQDLQGAGGDVSFSGFKKFAGIGTASLPFRPRHRFIALLWKEIQLHQVNILIAALILLLQLSSFIVRKIHPHFTNPDMQFVLGSIWLLWLLMPILIGCSAIAEERRFGIMESQLSLPVSRRMQLFIKFSVALVLSLFLGAAFPLLARANFSPGYLLLIIVAGLFFISFYASSMARTVLQAMGLAIVIGTALFFYQIRTGFNIFQYNSLHPGPGYYMYEGNFGFDLLKVYLGTAILLLTLAGLTYWNYKRLRQNNTMVLANLVAMIVVFVTIPVLAYAIYFRAWEYVMPNWPPRGPTRLSQATGVKLDGSSGAIYAVLPDGRLWIQTRYYRPLLNGFAVSSRGSSEFITGSNWMQAASDNFQAVGIRSDGSLWSIRWPGDASRRWVDPKGPVKLAQIGPDTNWSQVAVSHLGFLLLKNDGSLWVWGTNGLDWTNDRDRFQKSLAIKLESDLAVPPARLGNETNWSQLYSREVTAYALNNNGNVWSWMPWYGTNFVSRFEQDCTPSGPWLSFTHGWFDGMYIGVKADGTLWFRNHITVNGKDKTSFQQLGKGAKWKAATFVDWNAWNGIIAIRSDGTLWNCSEFNPVQLGTHSDWIALSPGGLALAADGSLWAWNQPSWHIWLAPSRKPAYMGNIFQGTTATAAANP